MVKSNGCLLIMVIGILHSSVSSFLTQSPAESKPKRYEIEAHQRKIESLQVFVNKLMEKNAKEDEIRSLQRERLKAALLGVEVLKQKHELGLINIASFFQFLKVAGVAALEVAESSEEKTQCLEFVLEISRGTEYRVLALRNIGARGGEADVAAQATYWRLDAEINLLKFRRDSVIGK